jgi:hypothetical protein
VRLKFEALASPRGRSNFRPSSLGQFTESGWLHMPPRSCGETSLAYQQLSSCSPQAPLAGRPFLENQTRRSSNRCKPVLESSTVEIFETIRGVKLGDPSGAELPARRIRHQSMDSCETCLSENSFFIRSANAAGHAGCQPRPPGEFQITIAS